MGSVPSELSFDSMTVSTKTMTNILQTIGGSPPANKVDSLLSELQAEVKKIDSIRNQLPLSMLLLTDAIAAVKEWIDSSAGENQKQKQKQEPVLEEFIPLKNGCGDDDDEGKECGVKEEKDSSKDKRSWMSSVQLWSSDDSVAAKPKPGLESKESKKGNGDALSRELMISPKEEEGNGGGDEDLGVPDLSLLTPGMKSFAEEFVGVSQCDSLSDLRVPHHHHQPPLHGSRKQRRCWSAELHRRFVSALQQLGGSQAATPKQIREIMQVDGLTNDEVKSHLQKYRLHTRRTTPSGSAPANQPPVVLGGGLWMSSQEQCSKAATSQSNSPQGPLQFGRTLTGGDSMEDDNEDDAKSENYYSWKCHAHRPGKVGV